MDLPKMKDQTACGRKSFLDLHLAGAKSLYEVQPQGQNPDESSRQEPMPPSEEIPALLQVWLQRFHF